MHVDPRQFSTRRSFLRGGALFGGGLLLGGAGAVAGARAVSGGGDGGTGPRGDGSPVAGDGGSAPEPDVRVAVRPRRLVEGDLVRLVSPAGPPDRGLVDIGVRLLEGWGLRVELSEHALESAGYLSASDADRLSDLNTALADPEVRAVVATRGGYGVQRVVDEVDYGAVAADPKLVVGYSDITALHTALWRNASVATLHAPMAAWHGELNTAGTERSLRRALMSSADVRLERDPDAPTAPVKAKGTASGTLLGGNLSTLVAERGAWPDLTGAILFLEEVREEPYRIDAMLTELLRAGVLDGVVAVAVGQFTECTGGQGTWSAADVLKDRLGELGVPMAGGFPVGHGYDPRALPLGTRAELDGKAGTLTVEAAVIE
ncbi:S66 peptidase family protein [Phytomonospora endophytica]|uniref:Muramoyltetrapeptide carboxypeptidase n=1 Tax=Phytomonospora endophytica TaxID=714109 RepID=A0A841FJM3_9ACTN|nr:LD-carboxypeptidase [Phytomonospora endophytica]MBB6032180.1 muramoyltetrapeptide carboxypeptidase [Phytomonospora endophytica]GIG68529.1 peptidase S66 [Phytomonospora endophytica]